MGCIRQAGSRYVAEARKQRNREDSARRTYRRTKTSVQTNEDQSVGFSLPGSTADVDRLFFFLGHIYDGRGVFLWLLRRNVLVAHRST